MNEFKVIGMFKKAYNIYNKLLSDVAKEENLTLNQLQILMFLSKNSENNISKNVVEGLGATKSHISMSVTNLEQAGYIEKVQDENDKKISHLHLTKKSIKAVEEGMKVQQKVKEIMFDEISEDEIKMLNEVAKKVEKNLENYNCI